MFASKALVALFAFALTAPRGPSRFSWRKSFEFNHRPSTAQPWKRTWSGALSREHRAARVRQKERQRERKKLSKAFGDAETF